MGASGAFAVPELIAEMRGGTAVFRVDHKNVNVVMGWYRSDLKLEVAIPKGYRGALAIRLGVGVDPGAARAHVHDP